MDLGRQALQKEVLTSSVRFAGEIGASTVVCHAGQRVASRDARFRLRDQLSAERAALREVGDIAIELGVTVAVENYLPDKSVLVGEAYDYSTWPSDLAEQISAVDHPAVGICPGRGTRGPGGELLRLRLPARVRRGRAARPSHTPPRQPAKDLPQRGPRRLRGPCLRRGRFAPAAGPRLRPTRRTVPVCRLP